LPQFAKKLSLHLDINDVQQSFIQQLNELFSANKGDNTVTFEIVELEKVQKAIEPLPKVVLEEDSAADTEILDEVEIEIPVIEEQIQVATRISMPSRKLKVRISNELLIELEKRNIKFSLN
jgi:DNA polymerase-3 subunit alpha